MEGFTAFAEGQIVARGTLEEVALALKTQCDAGQLFEGQFQVIDNTTGNATDLNLSGTESSVRQRYRDQAQPDAKMEEPDSPRSRGRPKLGVVSREVTLLPRQWEWLALQPGGASVALRKLIDEARREHTNSDQARARQERTYKAMSQIAAHLPFYEDALRALFASDREKFLSLVEQWPTDLRSYMLELAGFAD